MATLSQVDCEQLASDLARAWGAGDAILLSGPLGAGKTTLARAVLRAVGWRGAVRSPTFPLLQIYETKPPIAHIDLYRVSSADGIGLEEYLDSHLCLIEWPDRLGAMIDPARCWQIDIQFASGEDEGRRAVTVTPPSVLG